MSHSDPDPKIEPQVYLGPIKTSRTFLDALASLAEPFVTDWLTYAFSNHPMCLFIWSETVTSKPSDYADLIFAVGSLLIKKGMAMFLNILKPIICLDD